MSAVLLECGRVPSRRDLRDISSRTRVPWIPPVSFPADPRVARRGAERISESGIPSGAAANRRIISQLLPGREEVHMTGPGTDLVIRFPEQLRLSGRTRPELLPDEPSAIGYHFESAMSPTDLTYPIDTGLTVF
ncbi:hypothetical protein AB0N16_02485 [Streptomyces sp. NPDC051105]|uniref:hypothetical protein n=1 Tax=Streptomyces sp. NPDC051105 TaxID=3154843 RepID=UPI003415E292